MPFQILSDHPLPPSHTLLPTIEEKDSLKHIETLRARLGFARFKLNHGWESSTLLDVEQLWKQKQQKLVSVLPKPRFTQRDIIDKKVFIPSPSAKYQKSKRQKLLRTYSQPSLNIPKRRSSKTNIESTPKSPQTDSLPPIQQDLIQHQKPPSHRHHNEEKDALYFHHYRRTPSPAWEDPAIDNHSSFSSSSSEGGAIPVSSVRNSLDFLSYAIAITENNNNHPECDYNEEEPIYSSQPLPDVSNLSPNLNDEELSAPGNSEEPPSPPSSPATSAAKAIMAFVNSQSDRPLYTL
ncbi:hypothetical protein K501DRAFT_219059 [Backusella circina FSU 941]|nr:hypothetical protein K501DRAFT_219059 [Backusella circina FSU 941]